MCAGGRGYLVVVSWLPSPLPLPSSCVYYVLQSSLANRELVSGEYCLICGGKNHIENKIAKYDYVTPPPHLAELGPSPDLLPTD